MSALDEAREFGLMTVYQTAKVLGWDADGITVGFPADGLTSEIAADKDKVERMRAFMAKRFGREVGFRVRMLSAGEEAEAVSVLEDAKQRAKEERIKRREEAESHPMTKMVLKTFGAQIKEIKVHV